MAVLINGPDGEKIPFQECWREISKTQERSFPEQMRDYKKTFELWSPPTERKDSPECVGEDPKYSLEIATKRLDAINSAKDVVALQKVLVIVNGNQFRLRDIPTAEEFEKIIFDFRSWSLGPEACWVGSDEEKNRAKKAIEDVIIAANTKFKELTM